MCPGAFENIISHTNESVAEEIPEDSLYGSCDNLTSSVISSNKSLFILSEKPQPNLYYVKSPFQHGKSTHEFQKFSFGKRLLKMKKAAKIKDRRFGSDIIQHKKFTVNTSLTGKEDSSPLLIDNSLVMSILPTTEKKSVSKSKLPIKSIGTPYAFKHELHVVFDKKDNLLKANNLTLGHNLQRMHLASKGTTSADNLVIEKSLDRRLDEVEEKSINDERCAEDPEETMTESARIYSPTEEGSDDPEITGQEHELKKLYDEDSTCVLYDSKNDSTLTKVDTTSKKTSTGVFRISTVVDMDNSLSEIAEKLLIDNKVPTKCNKEEEYQAIKEIETLGFSEVPSYHSNETTKHSTTFISVPQEMSANAPYIINDKQSPILEKSKVIENNIIFSDYSDQEYSGGKTEKVNDETFDTQEAHEEDSGNIKSSSTTIRRSSTTGDINIFGNSKSIVSEASLTMTPSFFIKDGDFFQGIDTNPLGSDWGSSISKKESTELSYRDLIYTTCSHPRKVLYSRSNRETTEHKNMIASHTKLPEVLAPKSRKIDFKVKRLERLSKNSAKGKSFTINELACKRSTKERIMLRRNPEPVFCRAASNGYSEETYGGYYVSVAPVPSTNSETQAVLDITLPQLLMDIKNIDILRFYCSGQTSGNYVAMLKANGSMVILKKVSKENKPRLDRLKREISLLQTLSCANLIAFLGVGLDTECIWVASEFMDRLALINLLRLYPKHILPIPQAALCLYSVISAVEYLHKHSIVHTNINSKNVLFNSKGEVKLAGIFSLKKCLPTQSIYIKSANTHDTAAPEVGNQLGYCQKSDIWSVGILGYKILYGCRPYSTQNPDDALLTISTAGISIALEEQPVNTGEGYADLMDFVRDACAFSVDLRKSASELVMHPFFEKRASQESMLSFTSKAK